MIGKMVEEKKERLLEKEGVNADSDRRLYPEMKWKLMKNGLSWEGEVKWKEINSKEENKEEKEKEEEAKEEE